MTYDFEDTVRKNKAKKERERKDRETANARTTRDYRLKVGENKRKKKGVGEIEERLDSIREKIDLLNKKMEDEDEESK